MRASFALSLVLSALFACASPRYVFAPVTTTGADIAGVAAASYPLPPDAPHGELRIATFGIAELDPGKHRAVYLRLVVTNRSDEMWTVDGSEQRLVLEVRDRITLAPVTSRSTRVEPVEVPPRSTRTVDLFFPLPASLQQAREIPAFDASWTVHLGPRVVSDRARFERFLAEPRPRPLETPGPLEPHYVDTLPGTEPPDRHIPAR